MQRLRNNDRGATAVIVALLMVPLLALAAVAIDIAAMHADKQQLQTGTDAAALAVAQDCARGSCDDTLADATAMELTEVNKYDGQVEQVTVDLDRAAGSVTVRAEAIREHWFAPVIGIDASPVAAVATARWGYPSAGTAVLPLVFEICEISAQTGIGFTTDPTTGEIVGLDIDGTTQDVRLVQTKESRTDCTGPSNNTLPGGFGWLVPEERIMECQARTVVGQDAESDPGKNFPCNTIFEGDSLHGLLGKTAFLPVFDEASGEGNNGRYSIIGYVAFVLTDYYFGSQYDNPATGGLCDGRTGNDHCVAGRFVTYTDTAGQFELDPNGRNFGAAVVELTLPES